MFNQAVGNFKRTLTLTYSNEYTTLYALLGCSQTLLDCFGIITPFDLIIWNHYSGRRFEVYELLLQSAIKVSSLSLICLRTLRDAKSRSPYGTEGLIVMSRT